MTDAKCCPASVGIGFFLRSLTEQVARLEKKVEREKIVMAALPELSLRIVEFAREHARVTMSGQAKRRRLSIVALDIARGSAGFTYSSVGYHWQLEGASSRNQPR